MKIKHRTRPLSSRGYPSPRVTRHEDPERVRLTLTAATRVFAR
jgi:hypothetical protein